MSGHGWIGYRVVDGYRYVMNADVVGVLWCVVYGEYSGNDTEEACKIFKEKVMCLSSVK